VGRLYVSLKRGKVYADIFYKGVKIMTLKVDEMNRGNVAIIALEAESDVRFSLVKTNSSIENDSEEENKFNKEIYNK
jgi:hypothetical protein